MVKRDNCSGESFISTNIMDYFIGYKNQFTANQRIRIRHVLNYSPLIPGPKLNSSRTSYPMTEEPFDLPFRVVKCASHIH